MRLGVSHVLLDNALVAGDLVVDDGVVRDIVEPSSGGNVALPGFVDLQVNGFAGVDFLRAEPDEYRVAGEALLGTGVTAFQPTLITSPRTLYREALANAKAVGKCCGPRVLGVHLEGPFISPEFLGAHDGRYRVEPDQELAQELLEWGPVSYVTLAPERPGGLELIEFLVERGIVVACGHSAATAHEAHAAFERGARAITHIYNAQHRWSARNPGLPGVALVRPDVVVQAIVDHVHLAPETALATFLATRERFALVTDAIQAAAVGEGSFDLADRRVTVTNGAVRLENGVLAGSILTMDAAVRNLVGLGASPPEASRAASTVPARLVGCPELGEIRVGEPADIVVLDDRLEVTRTLVEGAERFARR